MLFIVNSNGVPSVASFVSLPIGAPPTQVAVPSVANQTQASAAAGTHRFGPHGRHRSRPRRARRCLRHRSISQNPIAGTLVCDGQRGCASSSPRAPGSSRCPNVVNATQAAATAAITGAGLTLGAVTTASSATVPAGSVISQNPAAGAASRVGQPVALVVSTGTGAHHGAERRQPRRRRAATADTSPA